MTTARRPCRHCGADVLLLACHDGRWRIFTTVPVPVNTETIRAVWAWRRGRGMTPGDPADPNPFPAQGLILHYCAPFGEARLMANVATVDPADGLSPPGAQPCA